MSNKLQELITQLAKDNPKFLEGLEAAAAAGIKQDKTAIYELFIKENKDFNYEKLDTVLSRQENQRIDINWNKEDYIYRIVVSKRKKEPIKERKPRTTKVSEVINGTSINIAANAEGEDSSIKE